MKKKIVLNLLFLMFLLILLTNKVFANDVPEAVINKARELNQYNPDNIIILQDTYSGRFFVPYCLSGHEHGTDLNWKFTLWDTIYGYICPSFSGVALVEVTSDGFQSKTISVRNLNSKRSNLIISSEFTYNLDVTGTSQDFKLIPVFADNSITCKNILGRNDGDVFFQVPPPQQEVAEVKPTLVQVLEGVGVQEMKQATKEIVVILPVILSVLVSLLALLNFLKVLLNFLKKL